MPLDRIRIAPFLRPRLVSMCSTKPSKSSTTSCLSVIVFVAPCRETNKGAHCLLCNQFSRQLSISSADHTELFPNLFGAGKVPAEIMRYIVVLLMGTKRAPFGSLLSRSFRSKNFIIGSSWNVVVSLGTLDRLVCRT